MNSSKIPQHPDSPSLEDQATSKKHEAKITALVNDIQSLHSRYERAVAVARERDTVPMDASRDDPQRYSGPSWVESAVTNSLIKLRLIVEHNFLFIETLGLLATTRFVFELHVWLRLLSRNPDFGLIFFWQVLDKKFKEHEDHLAKIEREIAFFKSLDEEDRVTTDPIASAKIDRRARRNFCLYSDQAKVNGYSFQARLMEKKVVPEIRSRIDSTKAEIDAFKRHCPKHLRKELGTWRWKDRATQVGLADHYEFIYSYTSRLLHATPVSVFTDEKNLELFEVQMFLEYIWVSLNDIIELAELRAKH